MSKLITLLKTNRERRQNTININGVRVPVDRRQWSDELEREILKTLHYWR